MKRLHLVLAAALLLAVAPAARAQATQQDTGKARAASTKHARASHARKAATATEAKTEAKSAMKTAKKAETTAEKAEHTARKAERTATKVAMKDSTTGAHKRTHRRATTPDSATRKTAAKKP